jgi:hypothetical protein
MAFGSEAGFDKTLQLLVNNSLSEGYPTNREQLVTMFNTIRAVSYDRGKETQKGGGVLKLR